MKQVKTTTATAASSAAIQTFNFHGDMLDVVPDGARLWVSVRRVCEALGVDTGGQLAKLKPKPWACMEFISMQVDGDVQRREVAMIDLDGLPMWLATIEPSRVAEHVRGKLVRYQREAAAVLRDHFLGTPVTAVAPALDTATLIAALDKVLSPVMSAIAAQNDRLAALEERVRDNGILAPEKVSAVKARAASCAANLAALGLEKRRAASLRIHKRLKMRVGWYGDRCRLDNMPARHEAEVIRELEIIEHETRGKVESARQLKLPHLTLVPGNANAAKKSG
jgi:hypothetical protein